MLYFCNIAYINVMLLLKLAMPNVQVTFGIQFRVAF